MALKDFFNIAVYGELLAFLVALLLLSSRRNAYWRMFIVYLAIVIVVEYIGYTYKIERKRNYAPYHFLMLCQGAFFSFLFYKFNVLKRGNGWLTAIAITFFIFFALEWIMAPPGSYFGYSRQYLSFMEVLFCCVFYFSVLKDDAVHAPLTYPPFWIVTGLFFYYFGSAVMFAFIAQVSKIKFAGNIGFYDLVMGTLSIILYGSWIVGFIYQRKWKISSSQ